MRHQRTEACLVLGRRDKRADHAAIIVRLSIVQNVQPEGKATRIRIAMQITEVLHQHKRRIVFSLSKRWRVGNHSYYPCPAARGVPISNQLWPHWKQVDA